MMGKPFEYACGNEGARRASRCRALAICFSLFFASVILGGCSEDTAEPTRPLAPLWPTGDLVDVALPDVDRAILIAAEGRIFLTRDRGEHWQIARRPAVGALRGIAMADATSGWAYGAGVVLRTDDGGDNWRRQRLPARAADLELLAAAAIDARRGILVGADGQRFYTQDGGALWKSAAFESSLPDEQAPSFVAVACSPERAGDCWTLGGGIRETTDGGATWSPARVADARLIDAIEFGFGRVDVPDADATRLARELARQPPHTEWLFRLEAGLSTRELDRIAEERDPSALFSLIEARLEEVRLILEGLGVPPQRVELVDSPPWDYEDAIDDDRLALDPYWERRRALGPRVLIHPRERARVLALDLSAAGRGIAVGAGGRGLSRLGAATDWTPEGIGAKHTLLDVVWAGDRAIAVGRQGEVYVRSPGEAGWAPAPVEGVGVFFDSLRGVDFDPAGRFGLVVGEDARILRSLDHGATWRALGPPAQGDPLPFR